MDEVCVYCSGYLNTKQSKSKQKSSAIGISAINKHHDIFTPKGIWKVKKKKKAFSIVQQCDQA